MIDEYNIYDKSYRLAQVFLEQGTHQNFYPRLLRHCLKDARMPNLPTCDEVNALIIGDDFSIECGRDTICKKHCGLAYLRKYPRHMRVLYRYNICWCSQRVRIDTQKKLSKESGEGIPTFLIGTYTMIESQKLYHTS